MDAVSLLKKHFTHAPGAGEIVLAHSRLVADLALDVARKSGETGLDLPFIEEAALLHDIGVSAVHAPDIGCQGDAPYIRHGIIGRAILESEGYRAHAMVCERHIGVGLTAADIRAQELPLPDRDMAPVTVAEEIICFADLFFSKKPDTLSTRKSVDQVRAGLARFSADKVAIFDSWLARFDR